MAREADNRAHIDQRQLKSTAQRRANINKRKAFNVT